MTAIPTGIQKNRLISELTTFEIGGPARYFAEPDSLEKIKEYASWARQEHIPLYPIGGGSNILAGDNGFDGLLLRPNNQTADIILKTSTQAIVRAGAGLPWEDLIDLTIENGWAGLECLTGIPGRVGASPMQNIGAYGQEVSQTIHSIEALDINSGELNTISASECAFGYRTSIFKTAWRGRYIITAVLFRLTPNGQASLQYKELRNYFAQQATPPTLAEVRQAVLNIRSSKAMLHDLSDPNHRNAGSFFLNPIIEQQRTEELLKEYPQMPVYPARTGYCKLSAAWLIANSGLHNGFQQGRAKLSDKHVLCLVNAGNATAEEIMALAQTVQDMVQKKFAITLAAETNLLGI
ncbi:UDP-N-acetylmuramate dehydrogenase [bacterium]|nr:UDP-N-acetylmuramate dehydrogenase [bacterium]